MSSEPTTCNYCRGEIMWLTTDNDRRMPVDARPDPERGNIVRHGGHAGVLGPGAAAGARERGVPLRVHHAATCPFADKWNRTAGARRNARTRRAATR